MNIISTYIPMDWRQALARGEQLPERADGSALFADISGFTALTEALALELGPKRGAEELTVHLNRVYDALIAELHRYGGSVVGFSGDAITCWLDGDNGRRAAAAGLAMQAAMSQFAQVRTHSGRVVSLGMKAAVATGPVRRFVVGDPDYCRMDAMTGATLERLAAAEHLAERGEVVVDEATAANLGGDLAISAWRAEDESRRFAVVTGLNVAVAEMPWPPLAENTLAPDVLAQWLLPPVNHRLSGGLGEFLAELRPAVALFLRFTGIDYDHDDEAPKKLDSFIREVEHILARFDGSLIQLTMGDKGSYLYAAFGAPIAHEDDDIRAASAALAIQDLAGGLTFLDPLQIGLTRGRMRTGAYGSATRRTYGVLGDAVNLSARLMSAAKAGQILASDGVATATADRFVWEILPNIQVKGKREPVALARLVGLRKVQSPGLVEPTYALPMVGRAQELVEIQAKVDEVRAGRGQIVAITAEAGMGKSRLAGEAMRLAREAGLSGLAGECQSYGTTTPYLVWQGVWRSFFGLDAGVSVESQVARVAEILGGLDPALLPRLPLLGPVLNLSIPDNELTRFLDAKVRKSSLEDLLVQCVRLRAQVAPLLVVLEDLHWVDPLSRDLMAAVGQAIGRLPVLMLLVYRPPDREREEAPPVEGLPYFTEIPLTEFTPAETRRLVELKLAKLFGEARQAPRALLERIAKQTAGNPFYIEEVLNYLQDLGINLEDEAALESVELPTSIYALVLSRMDQLGDSAQITIKVASVIGRLFRAAMVWGIYPELEVDGVQRDLGILSHLELTPLDVPDPELSYLFKHIITQQVAYESLLYATRSMLHEQIGLYIERTYADNLDQYVNLLAFHYEQSTNEEKKRHYLLMAGEAARKAYANAGAIYYFEKALPLLTDRPLIDTRLKLGKVLELTGAWDEAEIQAQAALAESQALADQDGVAWSQTALGELARKRSHYDPAGEWFTQARSTFESLDNQAGIGQVLHYSGTLAAQQGDNLLANQRYGESLAIRRALGDRENEANVLNNLGIVSRYLGDLDGARGYHKAALAIQEELGNRWTTGALLNNLGHMAIDRGDFAFARSQLERALLIWREIGERWAATNTIHNLANVARDEGDGAAARQLYGESLDGWQMLNDRWGLAYWLEDVALLHVALLDIDEGTAPQAFTLIGAADGLRDAVGNPRPPAHAEKLQSRLAPAASRINPVAKEVALAAGRSLPLADVIEQALGDLMPGSEL